MLNDRREQAPGKLPQGEKTVFRSCSDGRQANREAQAVEIQIQAAAATTVLAVAASPEKLWSTWRFLVSCSTISLHSHSLDRQVNWGKVWMLKLKLTIHSIRSSGNFQFSFTFSWLQSTCLSLSLFLSFFLFCICLVTAMCAYSINISSKWEAMSREWEATGPVDSLSSSTR